MWRRRLLRLGLLSIAVSWIGAISDDDRCSAEALGDIDISIHDVAWEPERHMRAITRNSSSFIGALRAVFEDSIKAFRIILETKQLFEIMMDRQFDERRFIVLDNRIIVGKELLAKPKILPLAVSLAQTAFKHRMPNAVWLHNSYSVGYAYKTLVHKKVRLPTTVISKHYNGVGLMVPNPYFAHGDMLGAWRVHQKKFEKTRRAHPWESRDKKVFWRGAVRNMRSCLHGGGNYARLQAISLSYCRQDDFDVRCIASPNGVHGCDKNINVTFECDKYPPDKDIDLAVREDHLEFTTATIYKTPEQYTESQFLLNLPGSTHGSYSRNLNHLWAMGAVVLLWDSPYIEWYYPVLRHGRTHLAVNKSTAAGVVKKVRQNPELLSFLIKSAAIVDRYLVCGECQLEFLAEAVKIMHSYFKWNELLNEDFVYNNPPDIPCTTAAPRFYEVYVSHGTRVSRRPLPCNISSSIIRDVRSRGSPIIDDRV